MNNINDYKSDLLAFFLSMILSLLFGLIIIPLLRRLKAGQNVLGYVEKHAGKAGTTTMGGFIFALPILVLLPIFSKGSNTLAWASVIVGFAFLIVGFLDDYIKIRSGDNQGLTAKQKIIFQAVISLITGIFAYYRGYTHFFIPFFNIYLDFGIFGSALIFFVFLATTNCVNLTDGLDGLAGGVSYLYFLLLYAILHLQSYLFSNNFVSVAEASNLALLSLIQGGALIGFLVYNSYSAKVFMGDTGSLYLGGIIAVISIFSSNALLIPILGIMFVLSGISVIVQVLVFKKTGKRVFLMAPLHHHFEYKGHSESKIVFVYKFVTLLVGIICILSIMRG
ncbi:MAG: phospho-N-acetylmuramoyl-pentapeptide-transferase [Clostridia bacterium]|nr:phospho-N-acetylmuramoyl-pentapeptide-transferase [Clostridia bacterium]